MNLSSKEQYTNKCQRIFRHIQPKLSLASIICRYTGPYPLSKFPQVSLTRQLNRNLLSIYHKMTRSFFHLLKQHIFSKYIVVAPYHSQRWISEDGTEQDHDSARGSRDEELVPLYDSIVSLDGDDVIESNTPLHQCVRVSLTGTLSHSRRT